MILNRQRLIGILNILSTAVGNKVMQVADYVCFRVDRENRKLFLSTTDFNAFITIDYGDLVLANLDDVPELFLVNFRLLFAIVKASTTEDASFTQSKNDNTIQLTTNGHYNLIRYSQPDEFPQADFGYKEIGKWAVPVIQSAWNKAAVAVSKDVTKIAYQGVCYDGNFAASDNRRLSVALGDTKYDGDEILLMPTFGDILRHCKNEVSVGPNDFGSMFIVVCNEIGMVASVRTIEAKFVDYRKLLSDRGAGIVITADKQELIGAISRLLIFTDQIYKVVTIKVIRGDGAACIELSISNKNAGAETVNATSFDFGEREASDNPIVMEAKYHVDNLMDGVSVTDSPKDVELTFQDDGKLWVQEEKFQYLLTRIQD